jgi:hypothetical protein
MTAAEPPPTGQQETTRGLSRVSDGPFYTGFNNYFELLFYNVGNLDYFCGEV